jgi:hypothetical protein
MLITSSISALFLAPAEILLHAVSYLVRSFIISCWREVLCRQFIQALQNEDAALLQSLCCLPTMPLRVVTPRALQPLPHPHAHALWNSCVSGGEMSNGENIFLSHRNLHLSLFCWPGFFNSILRSFESHGAKSEGLTSSFNRKEAPSYTCQN